MSRKRDPNDPDITKEVDCSAFRPDAPDLKAVIGGLSRAVKAFERAGDHLRDGCRILKDALWVLEQLDSDHHGPRN